MFKILIFCLLSLFISNHSLAYEQTFEDVFQACLFEAIKTSNKDQTLQQLENECEKKILKSQVGNHELGAISERLIKERQEAFNPYVIIPHKMNYILPVSISDHINTDVYSEYSDWSEKIKDVEAKFQLSIKVPLTPGSILTIGDQFYFAFTLESWWQLYTGDLSRPFRETNYQPEFFYFTPTSWHPFGTNTALVFGFEHQSNGRSELLSRSWNRLYVDFLFEKNNFAISFRPWYRIPEGNQATDNDTIGDDNPDIYKYMGYFELGLIYDWREEYEISMKLRENISSHHGALELGITFPLWGKLRGYAQYFNGYGESLIDYNHKQQRFGIGIALTDLL